MVSGGRSVPGPLSLMAALQSRAAMYNRVSRRAFMRVPPLVRCGSSDSQDWRWLSAVLWTYSEGRREYAMARPWESWRPAPAGSGSHYCTRPRPQCERPGRPLPRSAARRVLLVARPPGVRQYRPRSHRQDREWRLPPTRAHRPPEELQECHIRHGNTPARLEPASDVVPHLGLIRGEVEHALGMVARVMAAYRSRTASRAA